MINWINEFIYFNNEKIGKVDDGKSSSNSTNDPMFQPETGKQIKNSAVQNKTQQGYRKFPYSLLPLSVVASNATSYMSDTENNEDETLDQQSNIGEKRKSIKQANNKPKEKYYKSKMSESSKKKMKHLIEDIVDKNFSDETKKNLSTRLDKLKKQVDINKNGIPDIDVISEENPLLVRKVKNLIDIIEKNLATGEQKGVILNYLINNIGTLDIPAEYKKEMIKKLQ